VTQWVEEPTGGRERGPVALARAWTAAVTRPRQLFRSAVAPADQAPGLVFAAVVVLLEESTRFLLVADAYPVVSEQVVASAVFWLALAVILIAPAALHLTAALQTVILIPFAEERAGVSETVQIFAYATAPCVLAGIPTPTVRLLATGYGVVLLAIGTSEVHGIPWWKGTILSAVPAALVFGYGFRGFAAATTLGERVWREIVLPVA